jgi:hypothetical protein
MWQSWTPLVIVTWGYLFTVAATRARPTTISDGGHVADAWASNLGSGEQVKVELSTDGGTTYGYVLFARTGSDGSQSTTVQSAWKTETGRVRISWVKNAVVSDVSNAMFAIC